MIQTQCYRCIHEKICNYHDTYSNAVEIVSNVSYQEKSGSRELIIHSNICFVAECPYFDEIETKGCCDDR